MRKCLSVAGSFCNIERFHLSGCILNHDRIWHLRQKLAARLIQTRVCHTLRVVERHLLEHIVFFADALLLLSLPGAYSLLHGVIDLTEETVEG